MAHAKDNSGYIAAKRVRTEAPPETATSPDPSGGSPVPTWADEPDARSKVRDYSFHPECAGAQSRHRDSDEVADATRGLLRVDLATRVASLAMTRADARLLRSDPRVAFTADERLAIARRTLARSDDPDLHATLRAQTHPWTPQVSSHPLKRLPSVLLALVWSFHSHREIAACMRVSHGFFAASYVAPSAATFTVRGATRLCQFAAAFPARARKLTGLRLSSPPPKDGRQQVDSRYAHTQALVGLARGFGIGNSLGPDHPLQRLEMHNARLGRVFSDAVASFANLSVLRFLGVIGAGADELSGLLALLPALVELDLQGHWPIAPGPGHATLHIPGRLESLVINVTGADGARQTKVEIQLPSRLHTLRAPSLKHVYNMRDMWRAYTARHLVLATDVSQLECLTEFAILSGATEQMATLPLRSLWLFNNRPDSGSRTRLERLRLSGCLCRPDWGRDYLERCADLRHLHLTFWADSACLSAQRQLASPAILGRLRTLTVSDSVVRRVMDGVFAAAPLPGPPLPGTLLPDPSLPGPPLPGAYVPFSFDSSSPDFRALMTPIAFSGTALPSAQLLRDGKSCGRSCVLVVTDSCIVLVSAATPISRQHGRLEGRVISCPVLVDADVARFLDAGRALVLVPGCAPGVPNLRLFELTVGDWPCASRRCLCKLAPSFRRLIATQS